MLTLFKTLQQAVQRSDRPFHRRRFSAIPPLIIASVSVVGGLFVFRHLGGLQAWELRIYDKLTRWQPQTSQEARLFVVEITEEDIRLQQQAIMSDHILADVLATLQRHQPRVIGLDIYRDIPQPPGHEALVQELSRPNVIVIEELGDFERQRIPAPPTVPPERIGFNDLVIDPDGILRRHWLYSRGEDTPLYSFALQLSLTYLDDPYLDDPYLDDPNLSDPNLDDPNLSDPNLDDPNLSKPNLDDPNLSKPTLAFSVQSQALQIGPTVFPRLERTSGGYQFNDARGYQIMVRYPDLDRLFHHVSWADIQAGTITPEDVRDRIVVMSLSDVLAAELDSAWLKDKVVLIGSTGQSSKDFFSTPFSARMGSATQDHQLAGVLVHTVLTHHLINAVLDQKALIWFWPDWADVFWIALWAGVGGAFAWWIEHPLGLTLAVAIALSSLFGLCLLLFIAAGWVPFVAPALGLVLTTGCLMTYKVFRITHYDALTGLPNRDYFLQHTRYGIAQIPVHTPPIAVAMLYVDINRFKVINEGFGHQVGDQLLIQAANRIRHSVPDKSELARVGGNEFALFIPGLKPSSPEPEAQIAAIADMVQASLHEAIPLHDHEVFITTSMGIALGTVDQEGIQPGPLLRDAHTAMHRAKALDKPRQLFASTMQSQVISRLQLEAELRQGLKRQEFILHYQPIISLETGQITGFEALVRWQHPTQGFVPPGAFIPVAEETGLIIPLGRWILAEACRQATVWHGQFPQTPPLSMGVNLSSRQFTHPSLIEEIEQILDETQVDRHSLKLEITESMAMKDVERAIDMLLKLKTMKLTLSIDDFGTGYSSLSYLQRFPTDVLKVDRSFVSRMENSAEEGELVNTIITLGHNFGMAVVAEGVETAAQLAALRSLGCEYGQGYFFAKPMSAEDATQWLERSPIW